MGEGAGKRGGVLLKRALPKKKKNGSVCWGGGCCLRMQAGLSDRNAAVVQELHTAKEQPTEG